MNVWGRAHLVFTVIGAVAGIAAGLLGNYLVNRFSWGLAVAVLVMTAVVACLEGVKAMVAHRASDTLVEQPSSTSTIRTVTTVGAHVTMRNSVVAAGDVNQSRTTHVHLGGLLAVIVGALALLAAAVGIGRFAEQPGGRFAREPAIPPATSAIASAAPNVDSPDFALAAYIRAKFADRNGDVARQLECSSSRLTGMNNLQSVIEGREAEFGVKIRVEMGETDVSEFGTAAQVRTELAVVAQSSSSGPMEYQQMIQRWNFSLVKESTWRICSATQIT